MSEQTWERLEKIQQESITDAIEWGCQYGNRAQVKTERIIEDVKWLIQQAERFEVLSAQHDGALEENKRLRGALEFYADPISYEVNVEDQWAPVILIDKDKGAKARIALEDKS